MRKLTAASIEKSFLNPSNPAMKFTPLGLRECASLPVEAGKQHLKSAGPRDNPVLVVPFQAAVQSQCPPIPREGFVQHLMSVGSLGQKPTELVPPALEHCAVAMHTPGVLPTEQGPLVAARTLVVVRVSAR